MSELVNFEPAKNGKISVVVGGISFLCDTEEDGRRRAATMLLREVVRLRSEQNNPVEQLANVRRELEQLEAVERVQPEPAKPCRHCANGDHDNCELDCENRVECGCDCKGEPVPSTSVEPQVEPTRETLLEAMQSIRDILHGSWDNAATAMEIADKVLAGWNGLRNPPVATDSVSHPPSDEELARELAGLVLGRVRDHLGLRGCEIDSDNETHHIRELIKEMRDEFAL